MLPKAAGQGQHFQARGHSFSLDRPALSRQITYLFFSCEKIGLQVGLCNSVIALAALMCHLRTIAKILTCERASNLDTTQRKMY